MIAAAVSAPAHTGVITWTRATVSRTVATASAVSRSRSSRLTCRGRSATTLFSARAPGRPARTSDSTRARETELSAASAAAKTPASGTSRTAMTISGVITAGGSGVLEADGAQYRGVAAPLGLPGRGLLAPGAPLPEQLVLQAEHLPLLVGLGVVVAQQVQHTVHGQQVQLVGQRVAGRAGLSPGELRAQHDVAEQRRALVRGVRAAGLVG